MKITSSIIAIVILTLTASGVCAAPFNTLSFTPEKNTALSLEKKSGKGFSAVSTLSYVNLSRIDSSGGPFASLEIQGYTPGKGDTGKPLLPVLDNLIEVPQNATVEVVIHDIEEETVSLDEAAGGLKLAPRQPPRVKSKQASDPPFVMNPDAYTENTFGPDNRVSVDILGGMRGVRVARLTVSPFRYNPATNTLKAATRISFSVVFKNGDLRLTQKTRAKYHSPAFQSAYSRILNYPVSDGTKDALITGSRTYPLTYVVVASEDYLGSNSLKNFIAWKRELGFDVIEANTSDIFYSGISLPSESSKRSKLQNYLKDLYDDGEHPPTYVLLVGDVAEIPTFEITTPTAHVTDLYYFTFSGGYLPEAYYGRFPADNQTELNRIIAKTMAYEQYTSGTGTHLANALAIAGGYNDANPNYANAQVAYLLNEYLKASMGYSAIYAFLNGESWTWEGAVTGTTGDTPVTADIVSRINSGVGFVNYTGHCDKNGWWNSVTSDHELATADISDLSNTGKYGLFVGNCCESSRFEENDSFGEAMVLAQTKGAAAYIGASDFTYWDEDFYWAVGDTPGVDTLSKNDVRDLSYGDTGYGNFDALWHSHGEDVEDWYVTAGQMVYAGNLAVALSVPERARYYFEVYNLMGDPALTPFLKLPMTLDNPAVSSTLTPCTTSSLTVTTAPYAQVALLCNGEPVDTDDSGSGGSVTLTFPPFGIGDTAELVISKQNYSVKRVPVTVEDAPGTAPTAEFRLGGDTAPTVIEVTSGVPVTFTNLSTGCPETYSWIFEGGSPAASSLWSPTVTYNELGYYDVTLTVANDLGTSPRLRANYIHVVPNVSFTANQTRVAKGTTVSFTDQSSNAPTAWLWTFLRDNVAEPYQTSTEQNPQVQFNTAGIYTVVLQVTIDGNPYTLTRDDYITVTGTGTPDGTETKGSGGGCFILSTEF
jgi:PKD repeat protein